MRSEEGRHRRIGRQKGQTEGSGQKAKGKYHTLGKLAECLGLGRFAVYRDGHTNVPRLACKDIPEPYT